MIETSTLRGYVIELLSLACDGRRFAETSYVLRGDPDWLPDGVTLTDRCGRIWRTDKLEEAKFFPSVDAAVNWMATVSTRMPIRPYDGKPNRPFTAYNAEFVPIVLELDQTRDRKS